MVFNLAKHTLVSFWIVFVLWTRAILNIFSHSSMFFHNCIQNSTITYIMDFLGICGYLLSPTSGNFNAATASELLILKWFANCLQIFLFQMNKSLRKHAVKAYLTSKNVFWAYCNNRKSITDHQVARRHSISLSSHHQVPDVV